MRHLKKRADSIGVYVHAGSWLFLLHDEISLSMSTLERQEARSPPTISSLKFLCSSTSAGRAADVCALAVPATRLFLLTSPTAWRLLKNFQLVHLALQEAVVAVLRKAACACSATGVVLWLLAPEEVA